MAKSADWCVRLRHHVAQKFLKLASDVATRGNSPQLPMGFDDKGKMVSNQPLTIQAGMAELANAADSTMPRSRRKRVYRAQPFLVPLFLCVGTALAQDNYEIQVYPSETMTPKTLLVELHSNFTVEGSTTTQFGMLPTQHQEHETIELTQGINEWSEVGLYIFTAEKSGNGVQWVGDHIRPRVRVPPRWHWPVGVSLSSEFGYARPAFSNPTWSWQIMPIVDNTIGRWYWSVNGTMVWDIHVVPPPPNFTAAQKQAYYRDVAPRGVTFGPAATLTYAPSKYYNFGFEYYSYYGEWGNFVSLHNQQQQFVPVVNLFMSPKWEINFGAGWGATAGTDHLIVKCIIGRSFDWSHHRAGSSKSPQ